MSEKIEKFDIVKCPKTHIYVCENVDGYRKCNMCGSPVLRMPPKHAMHKPPKPFQCMNCDVEIDEVETTVGDWMSDEDFENLLCDTRDALLLDELGG